MYKGNWLKLFITTSVVCRWDATELRFRQGRTGLKAGKRFQEGGKG